MKGEDTTFREELRDIETGWVPWVLAAAYFPVYILLDFAAGDLAASRLGLPQSVAVGLVSLSISSVVVLLFVLVNLREAAPRPSHGMATSPGRLGRGWRRLISPVTDAVLRVFVSTRDGVAVLLAGLWSVVAAIGGLAYRILALLGRPFVQVTAVVAGPLRATASGIAGVVRRNAAESDELDEPVDRTRLEEGATSRSPLRRTGATGEDPDDRSVEADVARDDPLQDAGDERGPESEPDETDEDEHHGDGAEDRVEAGTTEATDGMVYPGDRTGDGESTDETDPSGESPGSDAGAEVPDEDGDATGEDSDGSAGADEASVDDPDEEEWPDDWISASDV